LQVWFRTRPEAFTANDGPSSCWKIKPLFGSFFTFSDIWSEQCINGCRPDPLRQLSGLRSLMKSEGQTAKIGLAVLAIIGGVAVIAVIVMSLMHFGMMSGMMSCCG
jgi:hypothetical protein